MTTISTAVHRHLVETDLGYVHLRSTGEPHPGQPSLLLLHQVPASSRMWLPVMEELAPLPCVAPDLLNLGESDRSPRPLALGEHAELLFEAADEVRPGPKIVVGHHTGAAFALHLAASRPEQVVGLVLIGCPYYRHWDEQLGRFAALHPVSIGRDGSGLTEAWLASIGALAPDAPDDRVLAVFTDKMRAAPIWFEAHVALFATDVRALIAAARDDSRPTLLIAPRHDRFTASGIEAAALLGVEPQTVDGASYVLLEHPGQVARLVGTVARRAGVP